MHFLALILLAQTETASSVSGTISTSGAWGQIMGAGLVVVLAAITVIGWILKAKLDARRVEAEAAVKVAEQRAETAIANAKAEKLEANLRLQEAEKKMRESSRLADVLVTKIEEKTKPSAPFEGQEMDAQVQKAKETKNEIRTLASLAGVGQLLESTVNRLGFSSKASNPEVQTPPAEGGPK